MPSIAVAIIPPAHSAHFTHTSSRVHPSQLAYPARIHFFVSYLSHSQAASSRKDVNARLRRAIFRREVFRNAVVSREFADNTRVARKIIVSWPDRAWLLDRYRNIDLGCIAIQVGDVRATTVAGVRSSWMAEAMTRGAGDCYVTHVKRPSSRKVTVNPARRFREPSRWRLLPQAASAVSMILPE